MSEKKKRKPPATNAQVELRVSEILRIRLDGAEFWDVREYAREQEQIDGSPWKLADGDKPMSDGQLWRYIAKSDEMIREQCRASRNRIIRRHTAQRRNMYAKAVAAGDYRTALACLDSEAQLLGLYPPKETKVKHGGDPDAPPIQHEHRKSLTPDDVAAAAGLLAAAGLRVHADGGS